MVRFHSFSLLVHPRPFPVHYAVGGVVGASRQSLHLEGAGAGLHFALYEINADQI